MSNMIFGYDFVNYTPAAASEATGYADDNLKLYATPRRHWRSQIITDCTIVFDMGSAKALDAIVLIDCNFTACYIQGNATNSWGSPSFRYPAVSGNITISKDKATQRYNVYIPLSGFNYQYARLYIVGATPTDGAAYFRIGSVVLLDTTLELTQNPAVGNAYTADHGCKTVEFESGGFEDLSLGDLVWQDTFRWQNYPRASINDIWTINAQAKSDDVVWYYNLSDTSQVYVCRRRTAVEVSYSLASNDNAGPITFRELR